MEGQRQVLPLNAEIVEQQLAVVRDQGYQGFAIFAYNTIDDAILEVLRLAAPFEEGIASGQ